MFIIKEKKGGKIQLKSKTNDDLTFKSRINYVVLETSGI